MNYGSGQYAIADRRNSKRQGGQDIARSWNEIEQELPNLTNLEKYFPYIEVNDDERKYNEIVNKVQRYEGSNLQGEIDRNIEGLIINGSYVTAEDFIRDYVSSGKYIRYTQIDSLNKECIDSLIESGYFVYGNSADSLIHGI